MSKLVQEKEEAKALIRGLLTSSKQILTANALFHDFRNMTGYEVPYRRFGFPNFEAFLRSLPDTVMLQPSGGPSYNVLLVSSEKSKHIDELVQKQKVSTKKKGPRKPVRYSSVAPAMTTAPCPSKPFIPQYLQKRISDYLADYPNGVELQKIKAHLWVFKLEQYGGFEAMITQLTHIVKLEKGKAYPVNCEAPKENVPPPPQTGASFVSNVLPSGYEEDNSPQECDDWEAEYSWFTDEETKPANDQATKPASDAASKQPTASKCAEQPTAQNVLKQPIANCISEPASKQPTASKCAEPAFKQPTAQNVLKQPIANCISETASKQPIANKVSEQTWKQPSEQTWKHPSEQTWKQPSEQTSKQASEQTSKQPTGNKVSEQTWKQPSEQTWKQPSEQTWKQPSEQTWKQPSGNKVSEQTLKQLTGNSELAYRPHTASNFSSHEPAHKPKASSFSQSAFRQSTVDNFSEPAYRSHTTNSFSSYEPAYRQSTQINFTEPTFRQQINHVSEPGYKQSSVNNFSAPANKQPNVKHLSDPASFSTFMPLSNTEVPKMRETTSTSHISEKMKKNLQILAEKYPDGIWCSELPKLYQKHFGVDLNVQNLGFVSVVQFVADVPEVFQSIQPTETDWMVFDARRSMPGHLRTCKEKTKQIPIPEHVKRNLKKLTLKFKTGIPSDTLRREYLTTFGKPLDVSEWGFDSVKAFLLSLQNSVLLVHFVGHQMMIYPKHGVEKELAMSPVMFSDMEDYLLEQYPADVVGPKFIIPQQDLPPDLKFCDNMEVLIAEVFTPSKFWLQLRGKNTTVALDKVMTDMQDFYNTEYNNELYKMKEPTFRELQYCVAPYSDEYHRALITRVFTDEVQVKFIDYGTTGNVRKRNLRYLHNDFVSLPAQAIRARLANLQPIEGPNAAWPINACRRFLELVSEKPLVAIVHTVDYQAKFVEVALVDTTGIDDVHINDLLKKEGYADYCIKKKDSPAQKQTSKQNRQVIPTSKENLEGSNKSVKEFLSKFDTDGSQNVNKSSYTTPSTSSQTKISDDEEPIIISAERRVLPPPGFSNRTSQQLPSLDPLALVNMALYQQALQQQQQQQMFQNLMMTRRPEFFLQGNSSLGTTFVTPYATNSFPVIAFPVTPVVMPNIAQVSTANNSMINTVMPNIAQVPTANNSMINTVMPNITQVPAANTSMINTVMPNITQVPAATSTMVANFIEVPANTNTVDSSTMTTFEEVTISELTENLNISDEENKDVIKDSAEANMKFQNNIPVQDEDLDEDFIFRSDSEGEETDDANELQAGRQQERNLIEHEEVVTNNYENVNIKQAQSAPQQHREAIIGPTSKISQADSAVQPRKPVDVKVVDIAQNSVHIINIRGEPHMCTDELVHVFTNFSGRHVILKILESKGLEIPFKEIKKAENPKIFHILQTSQIQGLQKSFGFIQQVLHMIPLHHVVQLLTLLKINDPKILRGVHATLEDCRTNKHFWLEPVSVA